MLLLTVAAALAQPTYNMPHAAPRAGGTALVGPGVALLRAGPLPGGRVSGAYYTDTIGVNASLAGYMGQEADVFATAGVRWMAHEGARVRLAPVAMLGGHWGAAELDRKLTSRLGLATELGAGRLRTDISLAMLGAHFFPAAGVQPSLQRMSLPETLLGSELGVSMNVGADHWVRAGLLGAFPSVRYAWRDRLSVTAITAGNQHMLQLEVGRIASGR